VVKGIKNNFGKLMLDSSSFIVSAFEDIFSYRNVLMCCFLSFEMFMRYMLILFGYKADILSFVHISRGLFVS